MRRLYFEVLEGHVLVLRARNASATFFHGTADDHLTAESALEDMGLITYAELIRLGCLTQHQVMLGWRHNPKEQVAKALDQLSDEQHEALTELMRARQAGFDTKFLQDLDEVK